MREVIGVLFVGIVAALFWGLAGVLKGAPGSRVTVRSLTVRISLSLGLFLILIVGWLFGWWHPHSL